MLKKTAIALLLITTCIGVEAQNSIEVAPFVGLQMFSVKPNIMKGSFYGTEAVYHLNMANNKADWCRLLNVNDISFAFSYRDMQGIYLEEMPGTNGFLGNTYGLTSRLDIILARWGKTSLRFTPGFGFTYATQTFYTDNNPLIGSHINFSAQAGLKIVTPVSASTRLLAGLDIYHYSNAAFKLPNDGVNSLNASLGIDHDIDAAGPTTVKKPFRHYNQNSFEFGLNIGRRGQLATSDASLYGQALVDQQNSESRLYHLGFYAGYNYRLSPVLSLKAGSDAVYNYTPWNPDNFYKTYEDRGTTADRWRVGAALGFDIWLGRVAFEANYGHHINYSSFYIENWYWTFGAKFFVTPWMAIEAKQYLFGTEANHAGFGVLFKVP